MQANHSLTLQTSIARRRRARLAAQYEPSARLPRALAERLLEHLQPIRRLPARILELGAAGGHLTPALRNLYPRAQLIPTDDCADLLPRRGSLPWRRRYPAAACASPERIPLPGASVDLLVCNLALLRMGTVHTALKDWRRVLRHDGVVMLATLGPLSFNELSAAWHHIDRTPHFHPFPDMHELGDAMVQAGFADVVMDSERLRMEFDDLPHLLREIHVVGGGNTHPGRQRGLTTPRSLQRLAELYRDFAPPPGCWATVEAVFAHGWVVETAGVAVAGPRLGA